MRSQHDMKFNTGFTDNKFYFYLKIFLYSFLQSEDSNSQVAKTLKEVSFRNSFLFVMIICKDLKTIELDRCNMELTVVVVSICKAKEGPGSIKNDPGPDHLCKKG